MKNHGVSMSYSGIVSMRNNNWIKSSKGEGNTNRQTGRNIAWKASLQNQAPHRTKTDSLRHVWQVCRVTPAFRRYLHRWFLFLQIRISATRHHDWCFYLCLSNGISPAPTHVFKAYFNYAQRQHCILKAQLCLCRPWRQSGRRGIAPLILTLDNRLR